MNERSLLGGSGDGQHGSMWLGGGRGGVILRHEQTEGPTVRLSVIIALIGIVGYPLKRESVSLEVRYRPVRWRCVIEQRAASVN